VQRGSAHIVGVFGAGVAAQGGHALTHPNRYLIGVGGVPEAPALLSVLLW
jgi:hypothetical protein